ncbi:SsgA family sporulation/cell division regulator [Streptomyces sp. NPDC048277]|uniref:SsgA family sporulation/cell division regulator n=1 Tax=Streptomyces sp. NPDC048277 TaxID=3155027 RepID=UPI0033E00F8B
MPITLEQPTGARLLTADEQEVAVPATLRYTSADPQAVHFVFPPWISLDGEEVTWTFARALLEEGLAGRPAVLGNVQVRPYGTSRTVVELRAEEGVAAISFPTSALTRFLLSSLRVGG